MASGPTRLQAWAVARIYDAKDRPSFNPLIAHVADLERRASRGALPEPALRLAETFWPGPLTIVAPVAPGGVVCDLARAGLPSVAVRVPAHPVAQALIAALRTADRGAIGQPLRPCQSGDGGACRARSFGQGRRDPRRRPDAAGLELTIVSFVRLPRLLRPGAVAREAIEKILGAKLAAPAQAEILAPGMTPSHYAPARAAASRGARAQRGRSGARFRRQARPRAPSPGPWCSIFRRRAISSRRRPISSRICGNSTRAKSPMSLWRMIPGAGAGRSDQ